MVIVSGIVHLYLAGALPLSLSQNPDAGAYLK